MRIIAICSNDFLCIYTSERYERNDKRSNIYSNCFFLCYVCVCALCVCVVYGFFGCECEFSELGGCWSFICEAMFDEYNMNVIVCFYEYIGRLNIYVCVPIHIYNVVCVYLVVGNSYIMLSCQFSGAQGMFNQFYMFGKGLLL